MPLEGDPDVHVFATEDTSTKSHESMARVMHENTLGPPVSKLLWTTLHVEPFKDKNCLRLKIPDHTMHSVASSNQEASEASLSLPTTSDAVPHEDRPFLGLARLKLPSSSQCLSSTGAPLPHHTFYCRSSHAFLILRLQPSWSCGKGTIA